MNLCPCRLRGLLLEKVFPCCLATLLCVAFMPHQCRGQESDASVTVAAAASPDEEAPRTNHAARPALADTVTSSRAARWREKRRQKAASLSPPDAGPSFTDRVGRFFGRVGGTVLGDQLLLDVPELSVAGVRPAFGGLHHEADGAFGLDYAPPFLEAPGRDVRAQALVSLNRYLGVEASYASESGDYVHYAFARYHHRPQEQFYGVGPQSLDARESMYRLNELMTGGLLGRTLRKNLLAGVHASYRMDRYGWGRPDADVSPVAVEFGDEGVSGIGLDTDYAVVGTFLEYDGRNIPYAREFGSRFAPIANDRIRSLSLDATSGVYVSGEVTHHFDVTHDRYSYSTFTFDAQEYIPLDGGMQHGLAFRQYVSFTHTARDQKVPFYRLRYLGGSRSLRAYTTGRYRDRNVVMINAEMRCQVWHWLDMAVFGDAGHVFRDVEDLSFQTIRGDVGVSFRLRSDEGTLAQFEISRGVEGMRTRLSFGSIL